MSFENNSKDWLERALKNGVPASVQAFSFNLFEYPETSQVKFGIELIGAETFDASNSDWACNEIWEPEQRTLEIPTTFSGQGWEECLARLKELVLDVLGGAPAGKILKSRSGVGIGFVDGDLEVVWQS